MARQRLGVRQSSGAVESVTCPSKSARGLAQSKTWRQYLRFMGSEHLQNSDVSWCHETNPSRPCPRPRPRNQEDKSRTRTRTRRIGFMAPTHVRILEVLATHE